MNRPACHRASHTIVAMCALLLSASFTSAHAQGQVPQVPAFLPNETDVPMGQKLPIDGDWIISTIHKRIRIEGGRAYALDPWVHLFVLKIEPLDGRAGEHSANRAGSVQRPGPPADGPAHGRPRAGRLAQRQRRRRNGYQPIQPDPGSTGRSAKLRPGAFGPVRATGVRAGASPSSRIPRRRLPHRRLSRSRSTGLRRRVAARGTDLSKCKQLGIDATGKIVCSD